MLDKSLRFGEGVGVKGWGCGVRTYGVEQREMMFVCLPFHFFSKAYTCGTIKIICTLWLNLANYISHI